MRAVVCVAALVAALWGACSAALAIEATPPAPAPLGATVKADGVEFTLWAPHAHRVAVTGTFNGWSKTANPLAPVIGGYWHGFIPGVKAGARYTYWIEGPGGGVSRRDPAGREVTTSTYDKGQSIVIDPAAFDWGGEPVGPRVGAMDDLVIYQMHIGTFHAPRAGQPGTFEDAIARLDHVQALGVNAIELLPTNEQMGKFFLGYGPTDAWSVEKASYGGVAGLKAFVAACHARGIAVIADIVHNHWGPFDLPLWRFDGWYSADYDNGIYFYDNARVESGWGPRPNYSEPAVRRLILDSLKLWIDEYRIDGFRWDSTLTIDHTGGLTGEFLPDGWSLMQEANDWMRRERPGRINIAEDFRSRWDITQPVASGGAGFDSQWHYLAGPLRDQLIQADDAKRNIRAITAAMNDIYNRDGGQRVVYAESHNEASDKARGRLTVQIDRKNPQSWRARRLSSLGSALALTTPGVPMIWQGQEFAEPTAMVPRKPMNWAARTANAGLVHLYTDLIALRRNAGGKTAGLMGQNQRIYREDNAPTRKFIANWRWSRGGPGDDVVVLANFMGQPLTDLAVGMPRAGRWVARLNSDNPAYGADYTGVGSTVVDATGKARDGLSASAKVTVPAYGVLILSQD